MSEEEKEAIEYLKTRLYGNEGCKFIDVAQDDLKIFLNLVDNQKKDIESWKKYSNEQDNTIILKNNKICDLEFKVEKLEKELNQEKEKNIKAGELLGKRINMCNQFQIELDKEKEKNKELEIATDRMNVKIHTLLDDNMELLKNGGKDQLNYKYIECPKVEGEWYKSESYIKDNYISKEKIEEIFYNYKESSLMENNTFMEFKKDILEE